MDCVAQTKESLLKSVEKAIEREKWARERAVNYLRQLQNLHGKLAMIKHENKIAQRALALISRDTVSPTFTELMISYFAPIDSNPDLIFLPLSIPHPDLIH